ncbi:MAG TPA: hypothetical protein VGL29_10285 [Blastocatellia bacterium]|jgi:hypothetical protein
MYRTRQTRLWFWFIAALLFFALMAVRESTAAQKKKKTPRNSQPTLSDKLTKAKEDVIAAGKDYKASLEKVLKFQEADVKAAAETLEKRKLLLAQNVISKKELEDSERDLTTAEAKVAETKRHIVEADTLIAEASAEKQLIRLGPSTLGAYQTTAALIRYNGPTHWALTDASKVEGFFEKTFHHALPISAYGQTPVHDQLGFDHHNAMDVAVSPDTAEGQSLMTYLRNAGIPFIAFRHAVKGSATGAHIHIGLPSHRLAK